MPRSQNRFFVPEYDVEITFVRNEHGTVDHQLDSHGKLFRKIHAGQACPFAPSAAGNTGRSPSELSCRLR